MKRALFTILLSLPALLLRADDRSQEILRKMAATFNSYGTYSVIFTATMEGEFENLPGTLVVSGAKYYLDVYDSEIFFDGVNGYTYSESNDEVIIETPDPNDTRLFSNPSKIFQVYERDFNSAYKGTATEGGKAVSVVELTPKSANSGYSKVTLYADAAGLPVKLVYRLNEYNKDLVLYVVQVKSGIAVTDETFRFDPAKYPGVEVIDFR